MQQFPLENVPSEEQRRPLTVYFNRNWDTTPFLVKQVRENRDGIPVRIVTSHIKDGHAMLRVGDVSIQEPPAEVALGDPTDEQLAANPDLKRNYVDFLLEVCRKQRIDVFVTRSGQEAIAERRGEFEALGVEVLVMPHERMQILGDKALTYQEAERRGVSVPPWALLQSTEDLATALTQFGHDDLFITKPPVGEGAKGLAIHFRPTNKVRYRPVPGNYVSKREYFEQLLRRLQRAGGPLLFQSFLHAPEVSIDIVADKGQLLVAVPRVKYDDQPSVLSADPRFLAFAKEITEKLQLDGPCNVQGRWYGDKLMLLEVNTRSAGGAFSSAISGVSLVWEAVRLGAVRAAGKGKQFPGCDRIVRDSSMPTPRLGIVIDAEYKTGAVRPIRRETMGDVPGAEISLRRMPHLQQVKPLVPVHPVPPMKMIGPETEERLPVVVMVHGWDQSPTEFEKGAEALSQMMKVRVALVTLSGHGADRQNHYKVSMQHCALDVTAAIRELKARHAVDENAIVVAGYSAGAYAASMAVANEKVAGLGLIAPAWYPPEGVSQAKMSLDKQEYARARREVQPWTNDPALDGVRNHEGRVLLLQGRNDDSIPWTVLDSYHDAARAEKLDPYGAPVSKGEVKRLAFPHSHQLTSEQWMQVFTVWVARLVDGCQQDAVRGVEVGSTSLA